MGTERTCGSSKRWCGCAVINNKLYVIGGRADFVGPYGLVYNEVYIL